MTDTVIVAIIGTTGAVLVAAIGTATAYLSRRQTKTDTTLQEIQVNVDGRLTELLKLTRTASHAEGMVDEQARMKQAAADTTVVEENT